MADLRAARVAFASVPHGHWKSTTFVGALRATGIAAPMVLDGAKVQITID